MKLTEEQIAKRMNDLRAAQEAITAKEGRKKPVKDIVSFIDCPVCKSGKLHYRISSYNGHRHAQCTTEHCVSWME